MRRISFLLIFLAVSGCARRRPEAVELRPTAVDSRSNATDAGTADAGNSAEVAVPVPALAPAPSEEPIALAYLKRLDFHRGDPLVPVRLMEGGSSVTFSPRGRMRMRAAGRVEKTVEAPAGSVWTVRINQGEPAQLSQSIQLAELRFVDKTGFFFEQKVWKKRGLQVRAVTLGSVYGIAGKVIDNRRYVLLLDESLEASALVERQADLLRRFGARTEIFEEMQAYPRGILELLDERGASVALAQDRLIAETLDGAPFDVRQVEYGVGYDFHGFQDRSYRGGLQLSVDRSGKLAVVNLVPLEELLLGLVPSEIYGRAHPEALKAQAVTARGEVLAKIGLKHLGDPYLLCAEQHCAVYKGLTGEVESTSAAVEQTRGEGLFSGDGKLVDSVYSAVCGGHTEDNDAVWGGPPDPSLRGAPDTLPHRRAKASPSDLPNFLTRELGTACALSSFSQPAKYRWEKRLSAAEMGRLTASLGLGSLKAITVLERGASGRAKAVRLNGERASVTVRGELAIRRLFGMLNSSMFLVRAERDGAGAISAWLFRGGGWGHGVGMCQTGAIGRAEAGQSYREILEHYFHGAQVAHIY